MTKTEKVLRTLASLAIPATADQIAIISDVCEGTTRQVLCACKYKLVKDKRPGEGYFFYSIDKSDIERAMADFGITKVIKDIDSKFGGNSVFGARIMRIIRVMDKKALPMSINEIAEETGLSDLKIKASFRSIYFTRKIKTEKIKGERRALLYSLSADGHSSAVSGAVDTKKSGGAFSFVNRALSVGDRGFVYVADRPSYGY